eukprot:4491827-Pyramimonas_sp.AAC.1
MKGTPQVGRSPLYRPLHPSLSSTVTPKDGSMVEEKIPPDLATPPPYRPSPLTSRPPYRPRNQYVAHGACSWESWVYTTLVTSVLEVCAPRVLYNTP